MLQILFVINKIVALFYHTFFDVKKKEGVFYTEKKSLDTLLETKKSLIRWGDGESSIYTGGSLYFQRNSIRLMYSFFKCVIRYHKKSNYLIALPNEFLESTKKELKDRKKYTIWRFTRYVYTFFFNKKNTYLNSFLFRENSTLDNRDIVKLWSKENTVFFVHSNYKYFVDFRDENKGKDVLFFPVTSANAFSQEDRVYRRILSEIEKRKVLKTDIVILISAGPAGKVLVYKLSERGIRALDMGHFFDYKFYGLKRNEEEICK